MPRVHTVKKARKNYPDSKIKKGDTYYWWKFRFGGKIKSKTYPRRSQLTQSGFLQTLYELQDNMSFDRENIEDDRDSLVGELESLRDECQDSLDNMPEHLQESSSSGELLQERIDALEEWISELENVDIDIDEDLAEKEKESRTDEIVEELEGCTCDL